MLKVEIFVPLSKMYHYLEPQYFTDSFLIYFKSFLFAARAGDLTAHATEWLELSSHCDARALSCLTLRFSAGEKSKYAFIVPFSVVQKRNLNRTNVFFFSFL